MAKFTEKENGLVLEFHVKPQSRENKLVIEEDALILHIKASPVKGKANKAIIEFLSKLFKVAKSQISILTGTKSKSKMISVSELNQEQKIRITHLVNE